MSSVTPFQLRGQCIQCNCGGFRSSDPDGYWTTCSCRHPLHSHVDINSDRVFQCERTQCAAMFQATAQGQYCACSAALWNHKLVRNTRGVVESRSGSRDSGGEHPVSGGGPVPSMTPGLSQPEAFPNHSSPVPLHLHADSTASDAGYAHLNGPSSARLVNLVNSSSYGPTAHTPASRLAPSFPVPVVQPTSVRPMNDAGSSIMHNRGSHGFVPQTEAGRLSTFPVMQPTGTLPPPAAQNTAHPVSRKKRDTDSFVFYNPNTKRFLH